MEIDSALVILGLSQTNGGKRSNMKEMIKWVHTLLLWLVFSVAGK